MSTCPTKDIHSLYLDNEMPEIYKTEYESHLNNCPKCRAQLERLKSLRELLMSDSQDELSSEALDKSFERLQLKMKYAKNTGRAEKNNSVNFKYFIPAAAAAAVLAIVIPVKTVGNGKSASVQETAAVTSFLGTTNSAANVSFNSGRNVSISDNMNGVVLTSSGRNGNGFVQNVSGSSVAKKLIKDVDVFRPDFVEDTNQTIKISVPNMNTLPFTVEIKFPDTVGQVFTSEFDK